MKKYKLFLILFFIMIFVVNNNSANSQAASATWALTSNATVSNSGNVSGNTATTTGVLISASPFDASGWGTYAWQTSNSLNTGMYYEFSLSPSASNNFTVSSLAFTSLYATSTFCYSKVFYSTNNFSSSTQIGSNPYNMSAGVSSANTISSLSISVSEGTTIKFRVYYYYVDATAAANNVRLKNVVITGTTSSNLPTVTSAAVSSVTTTTATGNGAISSIGGSAVTVSGVCWNTSSGPTTANSKTTDGPTTATTITSSITGLAAETYYYLKAYATNSSGTSYGTEVNFRTLSTEPTGHSATFTATASASQIDLAFNAASGYGADGYILLRRTSAAATSGGVSDGTAPGSLSLTDATLVTIITSNITTSYSNTGLSSGITYYYVLIPFNYDGSNNVTYNYYIGGTIPTANATTPENYSTKGLVIAGNFTNNGTFVQTNDDNYFAMSGSSKSLTGSGTYTNAKAFINGTITYDGTSTSDMTKTMINTAKTFTISNNKTYYNALMTINGTLVISATSSEIKNSGNWMNNGTFTANTTSLVTFSGASGTTQTIGGTTTSSFYNATMNNTSGGVTLGIATTITKTLTLTSGKLYTSGYTLTLGTTSANATVAGGSSSSYVVAYDNSGTIGYLKQFVNSNTSYTYPIGDATSYTPLTFTLTSNSALTNAYYIVYTKAEKVPGLNAAFTTYLTRFWEGTSSGITTPIYNLTYKYVDSDIQGTEANLLPIKKSGTTWYKPTGSTFTTGIAQGSGSVDISENSLTWTGLSTFSYNGGAGDQVTSLPIELITFTGEKQERSNLLKWNTIKETNNDYFTLEKTVDGIKYDVVGTINGAGNSNILNDYQLYDYNFEKTINYYRLRQTDFDGKSSLTNTISLDNREIDSNSKIIVKITNILGQDVSNDYKGLIIISYSDGSSLKSIR